MFDSRKTVLITGAGIGIGRSTAMAFAKAGYHVVVSDILHEDGNDVVAKILRRGGSAQFNYLNVTSTDACAALVRKIEDDHGALYCLVNNAGIAHKVPIGELTDKKWDETFDINLKGMFRLARACAPAMKAAKTGSIICLSSIMGVAYGWNEHVHYSAAKSGVVGLVRGLAVELAGYGIRANGIAPGYIKTAQTLSKQHSLGADGLQAAADFIPLGRVGEPEDIADVAVFLASDAARYITGQIITVDGGLLVGRY